MVVSDTHHAHSIPVDVLLQDMIDNLTAKGLLRGVELVSKASYSELLDCIASSLAHLPDDERLSLACLSIFPDVFGVAAAAAVLNKDALETKGQLQRLQNCWLVASDKALPHSQFHLHLLIKDIALEGFKQHPGFLTSQQRFMQYHVSLLNSAPYPRSPEGIAFLKQLMPMRGSLQKVFSCLAQQQHPPADLQLYCKLGSSALSAMEDLRLDAGIVAEAMQQLLRWAEAAHDHAAVTAARLQLGCMLLSVPGHVADAEHELKAVQAAIQAAHGPGSEHLIPPLHALATAAEVMWNTGLLTEDAADKAADRYLQQEYQLLSKYRGDGDPQTVMCIADVAYHMPESSGKIRFLRGKVNAAVSALGFAHPATLLLQLQLCKSLYKADAPLLEESTVLLKKLFSSYVEQVGLHDEDTAEVLLCLGKALMRSQCPASQEEGLGLMYQAMDVLASILGNDNEDVILLRIDKLAPALISARQADAAIKVIEDSMQPCQQCWGVNSTLMVDCLQRLAEANCIKNKFQEAEVQLRQAETKVGSCRSSSSLEQQEAAVVKQGITLDLVEVLNWQGRYALIPFAMWAHCWLSAGQSVSLDH